ncbi:MAG: hypothetical protein R3F59_00315 [Myxococcota bacterium]
MIAWLLLACADGAGKGDTGAPPTLARVQAEVFAPSCAFSTCHAAPGASGLVLEDGRTYDAVVDVDSADNPGHVLVVPGDSAGSYLAAKLRGDADILGEPMPVGAPLDDARLQLVLDWIDAGAPE